MPNALAFTKVARDGVIALREPAPFGERDRFDAALEYLAVRAQRELRREVYALVFAGPK